MFIKSDKIYSESGVKDGYLEIEEGRIVHFLPMDKKVDSFVDYTGYRIIPGIIDTHIHGFNARSIQTLTWLIRGQLPII